MAPEGWAGIEPASPLVEPVLVPVRRGPQVADLAVAASTTTADVVAFLPRLAVAVTPDWLARLAAALGDGVVAATPTLVHPERPWHRATEHDLLVRAAGLSVAVDPDGSPSVIARHAGGDVELARPPSEVIGAPLLGLVVDRTAYLAAGGLIEQEGDDDVAALDLCARLRAAGGRVVHVPGAALYDDRPVRARVELRRPIDPAAAAWRGFVERHGPAVVRAARESRDRRDRWVITTAAPSARVADRWGDWHFGEAIGRALEERGEDVRVQTLDAVDSLASRARDLHLVVRGLAPVRRTPGQRHVLWVISHPDDITAAECDEADLVLAASPMFAAHLRTITSTPVEVLLQATDTRRFFPRPVARAHRHDVTVVAKTRDVRRKAVADALAAGLRPSIYGGGWRGVVDPGLVVADHVDNRDLPVVYSSAGVVLNDHWDDMRAWGFVSNRLFDVLACGTPVISDVVAGIDVLFGGAVPTYDTVAELGALVAEVLEHPESARARAATGRSLVLAHHSFARRAEELVELARRHGLTT